MGFYQCQGAVVLCRAVVGIGACGYLQGFDVGGAARTVAVCHLLYLGHAEQVGACADKFLGFFQVEVAHVVLDAVFVAAQRAVHLVQHTLVYLGRNQCLDTFFASIRVAAALVYDAQHFVLLQQAGAFFHFLAQAFPVFPLPADVPQGRVEVGVGALHVFHEPAGAAFGQLQVVGRRGFGRGVACDVDTRDGKVGVGLRRIDGGEDLVQFGAVVLVARQYVVAVLAVLQAGGTYFGTAFHGFFGRLFERGEEECRFGVRQNGACKQAFAAFPAIGAAGNVGTQFQPAVHHPAAERRGCLVVHRLRLAVGAAQSDAFVIGRFAQGDAAFYDLVAYLPVDFNRLQGKVLCAVGRHQGGDEPQRVLLVHVQSVQIYIHADTDFLARFLHRAVLYPHRFQVGCLCNGCCAAGKHEGNE